MSNNEYRHALLAKLVEEVQEVAAADRDEMVKEITDLYEVIDALLVAFDLDREAVVAMQQKCRDERGGFEKHVKLLWAE
jgi:predicted house-cleaning noncanonical NTP pyrophosphatase (MazG superfamily)